MEEFANPLETLWEARRKLWRPLKHFDDRFMFDNRSKTTGISYFLSQIRDFLTIWGQQTVDKYANHSETLRETRRRALVTVEVL